MTVKKIKTKRETNPLYIVLFVILALYTISLCIPTAWTILTSLKDPDLYIWGGLKNILGFPDSLRFSNYKNAYENFYVERAIGELNYKFYMPDMFLNSVLYAVGCAVTGTIVPCVTAYIVARYRYKFLNVIYAVVIVVMALPVVGSLPSEIEVSKFLGFYDTFIGIWIMKANFLGVYFLVFHAQFKTIPADYTEAAKIDGASNFRVMAQIIMPLAWGTIFTVFLLLFIQFWNDYQTPMIYLESKPVVAFGMFEFSRKTSGDVSNTPTKLAGIILMALPIVIVFSLLNKKITVNLSVGGIKG